MNTERIICAAVHFDDGVYHPQHEHHGTGIVAGGHGHTNVYARRPKGFSGSETEGFLTSSGRFVDRREAAQIARAAGQVRESIPGFVETELRSDHLY